MAFVGRQGSWWRVWYRKMKRQRRGQGWERGGSDLRQHGMGEQMEGASDCSLGDCLRTPLLESVPVKSYQNVP